MIEFLTMKIESATEEVYRKRCKRWNHPCQAHALTFSCYHSKPFLNEQAVCKSFADCLARACNRHDMALWAYVFMPDHVHLLVRPRQAEYSISTFLLAVKQPVSRQVIRESKKHQTPQLAQMATGQKKQPYQFWQAGGGYDRNIISRDTAWNVMNYIHQNPVRRELVENSADWYYSSYKDWNTNETGPIEVDKANFYGGQTGEAKTRPSTA